LYSNIRGFASDWFAGGGGGGGYGTLVGGAGGSGGGGAGKYSNTTSLGYNPGYASTSQYGGQGGINTGGGGGGGSYSGDFGGAGGSGIVILRLPSSNWSTISTGAASQGEWAGDTILVFHGSGTYTV
jgi:hypothetical protein